MKYPRLTIRRVYDNEVYCGLVYVKTQTKQQLSVKLIQNRLQHSQSDQCQPVVGVSVETFAV